MDDIWVKVYRLTFTEHDSTYSKTVKWVNWNSYSAYMILQTQLILDKIKIKHLDDIQYSGTIKQNIEREE